MKDLIQEKFDIRKLLLYMNTSSRGFILLQINDIRYEKEVIEIVSREKETLIYNLHDVGFRDSIEKNRVCSTVQCVVYHGFHLFNDEELRKLLEKINLSRDILSAQNKLVVFIVPRYVGRMIQQDYPNLYAYFILKEEYISKYENIFEYVFPDYNYLFTKEEKKELKNYFHSSEDNLEVRMEYYGRVKAKEREYNLLKHDFANYIQAHIAQLDEVDRRYFFSLMLSMGDVAVKQGDYGTARELYNSMVKNRIVNAGFHGLHYEVLLHRADIYVLEKKYSEAIEEYAILINMVGIECDYNMESIYSEYVIKIFSRIGICYAKLSRYEKAVECLTLANRTARLMGKTNECFAIVYNRVLLALYMSDIQDNQIRPIFDELKEYINSEIQEEMFYLVYAWYRGVVDGHCRHALEYVKTSLQICRRVFTENDTRIAECHYVNSILYLLSDELEQSNICRKKCINILENYSEEEERILKILEE